MVIPSCNSSFTFRSFQSSNLLAKCVLFSTVFALLDVRNNNREGITIKAFKQKFLSGDFEDHKVVSLVITRINSLPFLHFGNSKKSFFQNTIHLSRNYVTDTKNYGRAIQNSLSESVLQFQNREKSFRIENKLSIIITISESKTISESLKGFHFTFRGRLIQTRSRSGLKTHNY